MREETRLESIAGVNNWKLTVRREAAGVTILRASTCDTKAALPETLWGLPVTALGDHALAPGAAEVPGEEVTVTCGAPGDQWDNRALEALTLPPALEWVGDYAFLNCGGLKSMALHDAIRQWGGGALMNCAALRVVGARSVIRPVFEGGTLTGLRVECRVEANLAEGTAMPDDRDLSFSHAFPDRDFTSQAQSKASNSPFPH